MGSIAEAALARGGQGEVLRGGQDWDTSQCSQ